jgi:hypothetical protein
MRNHWPTDYESRGSASTISTGFYFQSVNGLGRGKPSTISTRFHGRGYLGGYPFQAMMRLHLAPGTLLYSLGKCKTERQLFDG